MTRFSGRIIPLFIIILFATLFIEACKHKPEITPAGSSPTDTSGNTTSATTSGNTTTGTTTTGSVTSGSTTSGPVSGCNPDTVYFQKEILPILIANCTSSGCHDAASAESGVNLTNYSSVTQTADVRAFDPEGSNLYEVLVEDDVKDRMPLGQPSLPPAQIALIRKWILQGGKDLSCTENNQSCNTSNVSLSADIKPILENKCIGCHSSANMSGSVNLSTYNGLSEVASDGRLTGAINHVSGFVPMPQGGDKLSQCEIDKITSWINSGKLNN